MGMRLMVRSPSANDNPDKTASTTAFRDGSFKKLPIELIAESTIETDSVFDTCVAVGFLDVFWLSVSSVNVG